MVTLTVPCQISQGSSRRRVPANVSVMQFGDGYAQRVSNGVNALKWEATAIWSKLTSAQAAALKAQFDSFESTVPFRFTWPGDATPLAWRCTEYTDDPGEAGHVDITATLEQVFDLS